MKQFSGYMRGMNFGNWLCQCDGTTAHYEEHILKSDFLRVAGWGLDHVRIPFSFTAVTDDSYLYLDRALAWAKEAGLNVVFDMHVAPHYTFDCPHSEASTMFSRPDEQEAFAALWSEIAAHFAAERENIAFELLNEVTDEDDAVWNAIIRRTVDAIRAVSPARYIILDGTNWAKIDGLERLIVLDDPYIVYTWHAYEPYALSHQRAKWWQEQVAFNRHVAYPADMSDYDAYFAFMGRTTPWATGLRTMGHEYLERYIAQAVSFAESRNVTLYCGEFGCIGLADARSRRLWHRDMLALFARHGIGFAVWNYRDNTESGGFALIRRDRSVMDEAIIAMLGAKTEEAVLACCPAAQ